MTEKDVVHVLGTLNRALRTITRHNEQALDHHINA
jgi:hypothetical protein